MMVPNEYNDIQTPCFVYSESELRMNMLAFMDAARMEWPQNNVIMGFSVKTAPVDGVLEIARDCGYHAEVVSDDEYALALKAGYQPGEIVFNGPIKSREWLFYALDSHAIVNLDSQREIDWVIEYAEEKGMAPEVGLRINFDLEARCPGETVGGTHACRFGYCVEDGLLAEAVDKLRKAGIEPAGLHGHFSNRTYSIEVYEAICDEFIHLASELNLQGLRYLDVGGGYYGGGSNLNRYYGYTRAIANKLSSAFDPSETTLILEPGGSILCTAAEYCGKVLDVKMVRGRQFAITELSKLNLNPTVFGRMSTACTVYHDESKDNATGADMETGQDAAVADVAETAESNGEAALENILEESEEGADIPEEEDVGATVICGYTCMEMDRISKIDGIVPLCPGDVISIGLAGAYSISFAPGFFIQNPPAIYLRALDGSFKLVREKMSPSVPLTSER